MARPQSERIVGRFLDALERLGGLYAQQNEPSMALEVFQRAVNYDPYRESVQRGIMRCLTEMGRRAEALRYYREVEQFIKSELSASLAPETQALYRNILQSKA